MARSRRTCPACGSSEVAPYGHYKTKSGRRRRYRCGPCGRTFCTATATPYHRLQHRHSRFDLVVSLSVEGVSKSSIARAVGVSWNTVARWLERASAVAARFNERQTKGYELCELQVDEIRTFAESKVRPTWVFTSIEVWSRLWPASLVGRRSRKNTWTVMRDIVGAAKMPRMPLIVADGFQYYRTAVRRIFKGACIYGQVIKSWLKDRVAKVEKREVFGAAWQFDEALRDSEDSKRLNTSFVERLNLTIRRGCAYLNRKTPCHARRERTLAEHLELLRMHYNFIRPHRSLKFGAVTRTPAMQAGLATRRYSFREIFGAAAPERRASGTVLRWRPWSVHVSRAA